MQHESCCQKNQSTDFLPDTGFILGNDIDVLFERNMAEIHD